ncbi:site-specific DNA-methyltransferase [Clostridium butyricum]|uniref:site-specific DNA-methyltransferase n=1 Tax=Clostridium butyricum TaxID=1492 RepID=UPI00374E74EB
MGTGTKGDFKETIFDEVNENVRALETLFPSAVKDGQVDFEALKEALGEFEEVGPEKYELTWSGKKNAKKVSQEDIIAKTLKYIPEDSVNPDTTENLYIEGDNLEVLKLLRQNYYGAIKMIYIDPPYNTGNDFVYNDNFSMGREESDILEGDISELGERYTVNSKSTNKYHANWLNMMYPRLKVAKDLLSDDGVVFISIGQDELSNQIKLCNELWGESNCLGIISRQMKSGGGSQGKYFSHNIDYIIAYAKRYDAARYFRSEISDELSKKVYNQVELEGARKGQYYRSMGLYQSSLGIRPGLRYWIECPDGTMVIPPGETLPLKHTEGQKIIPNSADGVWRWSYEKYIEEKNKGNIEFKKTKNGVLIDSDGKSAGWNIYTKIWLEDRQEEGQIPSDIITKYENRHSSKELTSIGIPFSFAKPSELIKYLIYITQQEKDIIVLDFFSGSATTAHAVMQLNAEDGGNRKFIMVQLPEKTDEKSEARKAGYKNICEIGKERIRRAGQKIKEDNKDKDGIQDLDIGFKVFRVSDTNIRWIRESEELRTLASEITSKEDIQQTTFNYIAATTSSQVALDHVVSPKDRLDFMPGFKDIDVVYELLLRQRDIPLSAKVRQLNDIGGRTYLFDESFLVCLEEDITNELVEKLASINPLPIKFILRDSAFGDDINLKDETNRRLKTLIERNTGETKKTYTVEYI